MKKLIAILLAVVLVFALTSVAFAADAEETTAADILNALGLFIGTGTDAEGKPIYDLDRAPNRMEAVTMLVRLLGKEEEANAGTWEIPFPDVQDWAKPYVGYAYANGLTNGYGRTFGGTDPVTATQYLTFILRALGYSSDSDFRWDAAWELTNELGITAGEYDAAASFDRGDVVMTSCSALGAFMKGEDFTLAEKLLTEGVFTVEQLQAAMAIAAREEDGQNPVINWSGEYQCREAERCRAVVECGEGNTAIINIVWSSSAWELAHWVIQGELDPETRTIRYTDAIMTIDTYEEDGSLGDQTTEYTDGTGTIVFDEGTSFTWHDDEEDRDLTFEWSWNPPEEELSSVADFAGDYICGRARASVECGEGNNAIINILWGGSVSEEGHWLIVGELDPETLTIRYIGCVKTIDTYEEDGSLGDQVVEYTDGTGSIEFTEDGTFIWHDDKADYDQDMVFEFLPEDGIDEEDGQNPVMNWAGKYAAGRPWATVECFGNDAARIVIYWSSSAAEHAEWEIIGKLDLDTLTIRYTDAVKSIITYDDPDAEEPSSIATEYVDGTGTITFDDGLSFTWHEDQSETGDDLVFEWALGD